MKAPVVAATPERRVLLEIKRSRNAHAIRRFAHGAGGTMLISLEGVPVVLKAWPARSPVAANLEQAQRLMAIMRDRGVPVPAIVEQGETAGQRYVVYERMAGRRPAWVSASVLRDLVVVVDLERDAEPSDAGRWRNTLELMLHGEGDALFEIAPRKLERHRHGRRLLQEARRRLAELDGLGGGSWGVMHGDFAPENALVQAGRLSGVVDWEQSRRGDPNLDLVGILFDVELGTNAGERARSELRETLRDAIPGGLLPLYVSLYAVRYASWAVGTHMESEVLALGDRLTHDFSAWG